MINSMDKLKDFINKKIKVVIKARDGCTQGNARAKYNYAIGELQGVLLFIDELEEKDGE